MQQWFCTFYYNRSPPQAVLVVVVVVLTRGRFINSKTKPNNNPNFFHAFEERSILLSVTPKARMTMDRSKLKSE